MHMYAPSLSLSSPSIFSFSLLSPLARAIPACRAIIGRHLEFFGAASREIGVVPRALGGYGEPARRRTSHPTFLGVVYFLETA